jgi:phosphatidate cytidylyltransferase
MADIPATPARPRTLTERVGGDLGPRVVSGVALGLAALTATLACACALYALVVAVMLVVAWEWGRMVRHTRVDLPLAVHMLTTVTASVAASFGWPGTALVVAAVGVLMTAAVSLGREPVFSALGTAVTSLPAIAMIWLRADEPWGLAAVFLIIGLVVTTDTAAYFCGRLIGGRKLWPRVSPNKTWAGLAGAVIASAVMAGTASAWLEGTNALHLAVLGSLVAIVAQAGDLAESALKRKFGAKDASNIIPGHGGFMDRVDGLTAAAVFAALVGASGSLANPARALLVW